MAPLCNSHVKILEHCNILPSDTISSFPISLPLTFFDIPWLLFSPSQPIFFYEITNLPSIPILKHSLSLILNQFKPLAGKLKHSSKSQIVYEKNDSVSLVIAQSSADFLLLTSNDAKKANLFVPLVPKLNNLVSIQVTVFPNYGFCIGFSLNQVVADERTFTLFLKSWASTCKHIVEGKLITALEIKPSFDRTVIEDPNGVENILLMEFNNIQKPENESFSYPKDLVRATFVISLAQMEKIKENIIELCEKNGETLPVRLSPYVLASAYVWVSLLKVKKRFNKTEIPKNRMLSFGFIAGGIHRLKNMQVPKNYFGNCVAFGKSNSIEDEILGQNGIVFAAKAVAETIKELDNDVLGGAKRWVEEVKGLFRNKDNVVVVGSPKVDLYETDFGWGKPKKIEDLCIDNMYVSMGVKGVSFCESRDLKGGIEVGVVLPKVQMDDFCFSF